VEENREYRLHRVADVITSSDYSTDRSVFLKTPLNAGRYVIVPTIEKPGPVRNQALLDSSSYEFTTAVELWLSKLQFITVCCYNVVFMMDRRQLKY